MRKSFIGGLFLAVAMGGSVVAQNMDAVQINTTDLGTEIHMLVGKAGILAFPRDRKMFLWSTTSLRR